MRKFWPALFAVVLALLLARVAVRQGDSQRDRFDVDAAPQAVPPSDGVQHQAPAADGEVRPDVDVAPQAVPPSDGVQHQAPAADDEYGAILARPTMDPGLSQIEVQDFISAHILPMPRDIDLAAWQKQADRMRKDVLANVVFAGEAAKWKELPTNVEWLEIIEGGPGYKIKKLRYEAVPGLWIPALLYEPEKLEGKVPVVLNVNGHDSDGKATIYKQLRCINQAKRGMLALNVEWLNTGQLRAPNYAHKKLNQLDLCGTSGLAPFYLSMSRGIDVLLQHEHADETRVAVAGLSGGGWQTIFISSMDTRVTLANPVAGYSSLRTQMKHISDLGDSEQTPCDLSLYTDYAQMTAMLAPRAALLTYNGKDNCCFKADHALPLLVESARPIYALFHKPERLRTHVNHDPGDHNFGLDNRQQLYGMFADFFYADQKNFVRTEIPSDSEVKKPDELKVDVPSLNADFNSLAMKLAESLPQNAALPANADSVKSWQATKRETLAKVVRSKLQNVQAAVAGGKSLAGGQAIDWWLRVDGSWTVPATEIVGADPKGTVILVADEGRKSLAAAAKRVVESGKRALCVDPFYLGESKIEKHAHNFAIVISSVGERPIGIQADQLAAISRWARDEYGGQPVEIRAVGPRISLAALVAAGLEAESIAGLELSGALPSIKEVIEKNMSVDDKTAEYFCFGLLKEFDIPQLTALVAPRPVHFAAACDRARKELGPVKQLYSQLGSEFDPVK